MNAMTAVLEQQQTKRPHRRAAPHGPPAPPVGEGHVRLTGDVPALFEGVSWDQYLAIRDACQENVRITYDNGRMEIMPPPMFDHGGRVGVLSRLVEAYLDAFDLEWTKYNVVDLGRQDLAKVAQGDETYYVRAQPPPADVRDVDLAVHNPPDLVVEVDVTNTSIPKDPIYAALGVAEVWRYRDDDLRIGVRRNDCSGYDRAASSGLLPDLPVESLVEHLRLSRTLAQPAVVRRWKQSLGG